MARINGEGSWGEAVIKGHKYVRYRVVIDGKQKPFYGKTKTEALKKYKEYIAHHDPDEKKTTMTVCDVASEAIEHRKGQMKSTTYDYYRYALKRLEKDKLGALQLHSVTFADCQLYINSLRETDSMSTIRRQKNLLNISMQYAEDMEWIKINPMNKVKVPNEANVVKEKKEPTFLSEEERHLIEEESQRLNTIKTHSGKIGDPLYGITAKVVVFILHTGLRIGEVMALYWEDVDMDARFIHIRRNSPSTKNEITTPKKKASNRTVPLDDTAYGIIKELAEDKDGKLVFHTKNGTMISRNDTARTLITMCKRTGIEKRPTPHDLRHTYASELIRNGVDMKMVSVVLGHADISTTMNIYVHKSDSDLDLLKTVLK